ARFLRFPLLPERVRGGLSLSLPRSSQAVIRIHHRGAEVTLRPLFVLCSLLSAFFSTSRSTLPGPAAQSAPPATGTARPGSSDRSTPLVCAARRRGHRGCRW